MTKLEERLEACPRCKSNDYTRRKLVLLDRGDPADAQENCRVSCPCEGDLSVADLKPEFVAAGATAQFIQGLYCERCGIGYVPEHMAKPPSPRYQPTLEGWRRVYADGTLGPVLKRIYRTAYDVEQVAFLTAVIGALGAVWLAGLSRAWCANGGSRGIAQRVGALICLILGATIAAGTVSEGLLRPEWLAFGGASLWASIQTFVSLKRDPKSPNAA